MGGANWCGDLVGGDGKTPWWRFRCHHGDGRLQELLRKVSTEKKVFAVSLRDKFRLAKL